MSKYCGMVGVPEEVVGGICAHGGCDARVGDVSESEVRCVADDSLHQVEDPEAANMNALDELFKTQEVLQVIVGCDACGFSEADIACGCREQAHVKELGNQKILRARVPQDEFSTRKTESD